MTWRGKVYESHVHVSRSKFPPVEEYLADMPGMGISRAIISQNIGNLDNEYLVTAAEQDMDRFRAIVMFDYEAADVISSMQKWAEHRSVVGARLFAATGATSGDPLAIWRRIQANGWIASVRGPIEDFRSDHFKRVIQELPELKIRIEHLGSFLYQRDTEENFHTLLTLAESENLYLMWGGFYANAGQEYPHLNTREYLRALLEAYGSRRVMWSGDWNAKTSIGDAETCKKSMELFIERLLLPELSDQQISQIMGETMIEFAGW